MSALPNTSFTSDPSDKTAASHGYPSDESSVAAKQSGNGKEATASHPPHSNPDPTSSSPHSSFHPPTKSSTDDAAQGAITAASTTGAAEQPSSQITAGELTSLKKNLQANLRQFPDFPSPGILFEDIMPLFSSHNLHADLIRALQLQIADVFQTGLGEKSGVDVIVGLESRGFLIGPSLALGLGAGFVPVRKKGKLPGPCETESFEKEYGADHFQMQSDAIKQGQRVIIIDDIIATGGSASAAGRLVRKLGGDLLGYLFMMELDFLNGRTKLDAPVHTLFAGQEEALQKEK